MEGHSRLSLTLAAVYDPALTALKGTFQHQLLRRQDQSESQYLPLTLE